MSPTDSGEEPRATGEPPLAACTREIEGLHDFFVAWYTGQREDFARMERAIDDGFEMVTPDGDRLDRAETLAMVRDGHDRQPPGTFDIDIRAVELVERLSHPDVAIVRYEEWQTDETAQKRQETGRVSTATFRVDDAAPEGVAWTSVHETWLQR